MRITVLLLVFCALQLNAQQRVIRFGRLVDGSGHVVQDAVVIVNADTIVSVGSGASAIPSGTAIIDMRPLTAIPGMIDVHTHMTYAREKPIVGRADASAGDAGRAGSAGASTGGRGAQRSAAELFAGSVTNAMRTLETGVTTVRDLGASNYTDIALRDSINKGVVRGPRMFVAGYGMSKSAVPGAARGRIADVNDIAPAVKAQAAAGADWIKMYGSTGSFADVSGRQTFTFDEMKAAVDAAHREGKRIAIHSYGPDGARDATRAGAESVEHGTDLDDATIADMARRGTFYVPTIDHNRFYADNAAELRYTPQQVAALNDFRERNLESARRAVDAGVKFAMGSDAVYWMFGENTRELGWFVKAGMTPAKALAAATTGGAELLGMSNKLGKVAAGYYADIVAVDGDPLADIDAVISKVRWVMKGGEVVVERK
jgi:imidazolonepropionase-like amidohydrolase